MKWAHRRNDCRASITGGVWSLLTKRMFLGGPFAGFCLHLQNRRQTSTSSTSIFTTYGMVRFGNLTELCLRLVWVNCLKICLIRRHGVQMAEERCADVRKLRAEARPKWRSIIIQIMVPSRCESELKSCHSPRGVKHQLRVRNAEVKLRDRIDAMLMWYQFIYFSIPTHHVQLTDNQWTHSWQCRWRSSSLGWPTTGYNQDQGTNCTKYVHYFTNSCTHWQSFGIRRHVCTFLMTRRSLRADQKCSERTYGYPVANR